MATASNNMWIRTLAALLFCLAVDQSPQAADEMVIDEARSQGTFVDDGDDTFTVWFGGDNGHGVAVLGGTWDWDDIPPGGDPLQGWTSIDVTANPAVYFGWVDENSFLEHGDPYVPVFSGSAGQIWCGIHQDEAARRDFLAGMGYQNFMRQQAFSPRFDLDPAADALGVSFLFFNDSEQDFDFTHLYVLCFDATGDLIDEYLVDSFTGIVGDPSNPEFYEVEIPPGTLPATTAEIQVALRTQSDSAWSDEDGLYDCVAGPFAADDATIAIAGAPTHYDFEDGPQGWTFASGPAMGCYMDTVPEEDYTIWFLQVSPSGDCLHNGNALGFVDQLGSPYPIPGYHPGQIERAFSGKIACHPFAPGSWDAVLTDGHVYRNMPQVAAAYWRFCTRWFPYTSPTNPTPHWSPVTPYTNWSYSSVPWCDSSSGPLSTAAEWESLQIVIELYCSCEDWGVPPQICEEGNTQGAPLIDDIRVGLRFTAAVEDENPDTRPLHLFASPNPTRGSARLSYRLPPGALADLAIYDASGRSIRQLPLKTSASGQQTVVWDTRDDTGRLVDAGTYFCRLRAGRLEIEERVTVLR